MEKTEERCTASNRYGLLDDFQGLDLVANENGKESVFAIQYSMNDGTESAGRINWSNLLNSPGGGSPYGGDGFFLPSQDLINAYQTDANGLPDFNYQSKSDYSWAASVRRFSNYSWYKLGGFTLQPTELAKISFILTFAMHLNNVRTRLNEPKELGKLLLHLAVPILIIHVQGDDGTAIIYAIIGCCMMFAAGLSWKYILGAVSAAAVAMATAFAFFSDKIGKGYQWYRILAVIDPDNKTGWAPSETIWKNIIYQQQRGEIALGSGGIFGNGLFGGSYYSVPNAHNDFILSWIGNAAGFVGCCVVLGVLFALVIKTFLTGARSEDLLGTFICAGIGGALMAQIAVNVGMNLRVLPVIGVTLPFYSAGGSSVLMLYICVGLVLSVYTHNTKKLFG